MRNTTVAVSRTLGLLAAFMVVSVIIGALASGLVLPAVYATGAVTNGTLSYFESVSGAFSPTALPVQSTLLDASGHTIAHFYDQNRISVPLKNISLNMRHAIVAIEDSRFYDHGGVDLKGLARAFFTNSVEGSKVQGASTLTQQYIKNVQLEIAVEHGDVSAQKNAIAKDYSRKLKEIKMAMELEKNETKDQILEGYLNITNFGTANYGVEAASRYFFNGTSAAKLTIPQAAVLAGLVQLPGKYDPFLHPVAAKARRNVVLQRMFELNYISAAQLKAFLKSPLGAVRRKPANRCETASYSAFFCSYVQNLIEKSSAFAALGDTEAKRASALRRDGLTIKTTLDSRIEQAAFASIVKKVPIADKSRVHSAAVTVEPGTGKVLAMAQNSVYFPDKKPGDTVLNYAADDGGGFQTGSSFKSFTLATWLAKGKGLGDVVDATPKSRPFEDFKACNQTLHNGTGPYKYDNSEGNEGGPRSVLEATYNSVNTAFVTMESDLDLCDIAATASKLGVHLASAVPLHSNGCSTDGTNKVPNCNPSMTLGPFNISPLTMAAAYAGFANDGIYCTPIAVTSITDRNGKSIPVPKSVCSQALDPDVAHGVTYALKKVITNGTAAGKADIDWPSAGKTGTTDGSVDTWFVGYTKQRSTAVWTGDDPTPTSHCDGLTKRCSINGRTIGGEPHDSIFGATISAPIWQSIMKTAMRGLPQQDWPDPPADMIRGSSIKMPDVTGQPVDAAKSSLESQGFTVNVGDPVKSNVQPGFVAETSPKAGDPTAPDANVTLHPGDGTGQPSGQANNGNNGNNGKPGGGHG